MELHMVETEKANYINLKKFTQIIAKEEYFLFG